MGNESRLKHAKMTTYFQLRLESENQAPICKGTSVILRVIENSE
jgi:hypothetical protein